MSSLNEHSGMSNQDNPIVLGNSSDDLDNLLNFAANINEIKKTNGYVDTDAISLLNEQSELVHIKSQLHIRDSIINCFMKHIKSIESNFIQLKFEKYYKKIEEYEEELLRLQKVLKKKLQIIKKLKSQAKRSKKPLVDQSMQTETEDYDWDWYYQQQNDYFKYYSGNYDSSALNSQSVSCVKSEDSIDVNFGKMSVSKADLTNDEKETDQTFCHDKVGNKELDDHLGEEVNVEDLSYNKDNIEGDNDSKNSDADALAHNECSGIETAAQKETQTLKECIGWDSTNIKEEVQAIAEEVTNQLGYVFLEEIGMYYDHTSGYYYDHKTSLYYDGKTGTYFYYDHLSNSYQFYANVNSNEDSSMEAEVKNIKIKKSPTSTEKEEGECSESDEGSTDGCSTLEINNEKENEPEEVSLVEVAPSLRLMVMNGAEKGSLHLVTLDGGTIGREGDILVVLKSPTVSKVHAEICYESKGSSDHHYYIKDLGSNNGTLVQGRRISDPRKSSDLVEIGHGWEVQCGDVVLACHIHPGLLTCNECEPGLVESERGNKAKGTAPISKTILEKERRRQNKELRKKFSLNYHETNSPKNNPLYNDRAEKRRDTVGSDNPYEKTQVASIEESIPEMNKGFQLMQKMGWSQGQSLGTSDSGITLPVMPKVNSGRAGLGAAPTPDQSSLKSKKSTYRTMAKTTRERYEKASLLPASENESDSSLPLSPHFSSTKLPSTFKPIQFNLASRTLKPS